MKRKKIIPLVSIVILIVLIVVGGTTLFIFKTRDKENNVSKNEKTQIIEKTNETLNEDEIINSEDELPIDNDVITNGNQVEESKNNNSSNETKSNNDLNSKQEVGNKIDDTNNKTDDTNNKTDDKGSTIIEVSEEDTKKNDDPTQDEEYKRIKSTCEFFTREECQKALPDIQLKYLDDEHDMVSASCKSFAYKGQIVGYRVLLTYGDGKFFYNN